MVQTRNQPSSRVQIAINEAAAPGERRVPRLSGDIRPLIPRLGLRNYWYPALPAARVGTRKPVKLTMLGEDLCFFRGESGRVVAIQDVCPHRGARLSEGDCHYQGTVACPYHGWVYDEQGTNVAVLSEGPDSGVCGKPGTEARVYPTRTLKGMVFAWIGEEEPAPIEEDVPEEFFDKDTIILFNDQIVWDTNWEVALENSMDSHRNYLHRDNLQEVLATPALLPREAAAGGSRPVFTGNGFRGTRRTGPPPPRQDRYPNGWKWPKHQFRSTWWWLFAPFFSFTRVRGYTPATEWWGTGHRLPAMFRAPGTGRPPRPEGRRFWLGLTAGGLYGFYTRETVPIEAWKTRIWYFHAITPRNKRERFWQQVLYWGLYRWLTEYNFSQQDMSVMVNQRYDWPEKLSGTDAEVVQWRRLVVTKHFGGRKAPFDHHGRVEAAPEPVAAEAQGD